MSSQPTSAAEQRAYLSAHPTRYAPLPLNSAEWDGLNTEASKANDIGSPNLCYPPAPHQFG